MPCCRICASISATRPAPTPTARRRTTPSPSLALRSRHCSEHRPEEIVFTGGGTEASESGDQGGRLCADGWLFRSWFTSPHIITTAIEHPATLQPCHFLKRLGCKITYLGVDRYGSIDPFDVERAINGNTVLISIMHSNNEVGTLQPIREVAGHRTITRRSDPHRCGSIGRQGTGRCQ